MNKNTKKIVENDNRINELAIYAITKGLSTRYRQGEEINKFSEFKRLIKSGEFSSIDELEDSIYQLFGILGPDNGSGITKDDWDHCEDMSDEFRKRDIEKEKGLSA